MKKNLAATLLSGASLAFLSILGCGVPEEPTRAAEASTAQHESALAGEVHNVPGDTPCPTGYVLASAAEARAYQSALCNQLGTWDIARLAGGGSMDGPGYGCGIRDHDSRGLGHSICKKVEQFTNVSGDGVCPSGHAVASPLVARANQSQLCSLLGTWDIARLEGGGSMDGSGYGCGIRDSDERSLGNTLCAQLSFVEVSGDGPCAADWTLLTPQEARARQSEMCSKLGTWDIARLAGGGSMDGPGYGCGIRDWDTRSLGNALCQSIN